MKTLIFKPKLGGGVNFCLSKNKYAFTLVELIIVVTILAILATTAFLTLWNYAGQARDTTRVSDLKNIEKSIILYQLKYWNFPKASSKNTFWQEQFALEIKLNKLPLDPSTNLEYLYKLSEDGKIYHLEATLENGKKFILTNEMVVVEKQPAPKDSIAAIKDIKQSNDVSATQNFLEYDSKNRISRIDIRDNRSLSDWVYYKQLKIKFSKELIDQIDTIKVKNFAVDDWWEMKVNNVSVVSAPFPWIKNLVFCTLDNKNVITSLKSEVLQIDDPYDIIDDRELNSYTDVWNTRDFYKKYKISKNNNCTDSTEYRLEQMWTWYLEDWMNITNGENRINTPYIWVWEQWRFDFNDYVYTATDFKNLLKPWYNLFDLTAFVGWSWNISSSIEITYKN